MVSVDGHRAVLGQGGLALLTIAAVDDLDEPVDHTHDDGRLGIGGGGGEGERDDVRPAGDRETSDGVAGVDHGLELVAGGGDPEPVVPGGCLLLLVEDALLSGDASENVRVE